RSRASSRALYSSGLLPMLPCVWRAYSRAARSTARSAATTSSVMPAASNRHSSCSESQSALRAVQPSLGYDDVLRLAFDAEPREPCEFAGDTRGARAEEWVEASAPGWRDEPDQVAQEVGRLDRRMAVGAGPVHLRHLPVAAAREPVGQ